MSTAEWADARREMPPGSAEPGRYRSSRTPYLIPIMDAVDEPSIREVIAILATQMAKTELQLNVLGKRLDLDPVPALVVFPTENTAQGQFEPRLMQMLRTVPSLWNGLAKGKKNKITAKIVKGVNVRLAWAGSSSELASQPAGLQLLDERDRAKPNREGDIKGQVKARGATFSDSKTVVTSSPTEGNITTEVHPETNIEHWKLAKPDDVPSPVWKDFQLGTRHEWAWACPECGVYFVPRFKHLKWPKGATPAEARVAAFIECPACTTALLDGKKTELNAAGVYLAPGQRVVNGDVIGDIPASETASFWVSGLCSPWRSFGQIAKEYLELLAGGDPEAMQTFINTVLGECYSFAGEALPWEEIKSRLVAPYRMGEVPSGLYGVVAGVDVQGDRFVYEIRGFGQRLESWLIDCGEVWGDPRLESTKSDLLTILQAHHGEHELALACIDSGYLPEVAYELARRVPHLIRATKGHDHLDKPIKPSTIDVTIKGKVIKRGLQVWHLNSDTFKGHVYGRFEWPVGERGGFHVPGDVPDRYMQELTAEKRVRKASGRALWVRVRKANHSLDTAALTVSAAYMLQWHKRTDDPGVPTPVPPHPAPPPVPLSNPSLRPTPPRTFGGRPTRFRMGG